ncbi:DUF7507 domain-containing protein, partial [Algoriphagus limi]
GNVTLTDVVVSDPLTGLDELIASLAPGVTETYTTTYTITQADLDAGSVENTATATYSYGDTEYSESDSASVTAVQGPAIMIEKNAEVETVTAIGEIINYTLTVTNTGNVTLYNVLISDPLTGLQETVDSLAPGESVVFNTSYTVNEEDLQNESLVNTAIVSGSTPSGEITNHEDSIEIPFDIEDISNPIPNIQIVKSASITEVSEVGQSIIFTLTVTNTGEEDLVNVTIVDEMIGLNRSIDLLKVGEFVIITGTYRVTIDDLAANESFFNFATASGIGAISGTDVSATDFVEIKVTYNEIDAIDDDLGTYPEKYQGPIGNILINDLLNGQIVNPDSVDFVITDLGGLEGLIIYSNGDFELIGSLNKPGTYILEYRLCEVNNPSNCDIAYIIVVIEPDEVDLSIEKTSFAVEIFEGDELVYEILISNNGDTEATDVNITDQLPLGVTYLSYEIVDNPESLQITNQVNNSNIVWSIPIFPAETSVTLRLKVRANDLSAGIEETITNTVSVSSLEPDSNPDDNSDQDVNVVKPFFIPNVITPNDDGINDLWRIKGINKFIKRRVVIFNRWGDHLYEDDDYQNNWSANGIVSGTYYYILWTEDRQGKTHEYKGWIQVIREEKK